MAKRFSFVVVLLLIAELGFSQSFYAVRRDRTLIFSAGTGTSTYFGELQNPGDFIDLRPNLNVGLQYFVAPRISVRAEANWFQLAGSDAKSNDEGRKPRNLSFTSNNYELSLTGAVSLFAKGSRYYQRPAINVYGFAGVGYLFFNPKAEIAGEKYPLAPLMTEGVKYSRSQLVLPYGLGVRLKAGPFFNFVIEGGYRQTFTDYLDDVSTVHPDKSTWTDPLRVALSDRRPEYDGEFFDVGRQRGNPETKDGYFLLNAKIEFFLPKNFLPIGRNKLYSQKRRINKRRR